MTVLIAGIGNVFLGDDGFGVEVARRLDRMALPDGVVAVDYGIRGVHLAYELLDGSYDTVVLVDALPGGHEPGTVSVVEVDPDDGAEVAAPSLDSHSMTPATVLNAVRAMGGRPGRVLVIGCEPATVEPGMTLSAPVAAAVEVAAELACEVANTELVTAWMPGNS